MMWNASVNAICARAHGTGSTASTVDEQRSSRDPLLVRIEGSGLLVPATLLLGREVGEDAEESDEEEDAGTDEVHRIPSGREVGSAWHVGGERRRHRVVVALILVGVGGAERHHRLVERIVRSQVGGDGHRGRRIGRDRARGSTRTCGRRCRAPTETSRRCRRRTSRPRAAAGSSRARRRRRPRFGSTRA